MKKEIKIKKTDSKVVIHFTKEISKSLLVNAKIDDIVKDDSGMWIQIVDEDSTPFDDVCIKTSDGRWWWKSDGEMMSADGKIVEWKPLAPEGSAEWSLQMMLLGHDICNQYIPGTYYILDGERVREYFKIDNKLSGFMLTVGWIETAHKIGWKIYKSEPEQKKCSYCGGTGISKNQPSKTSSFSCSHCVGNGYEPKPKFDSIKVKDWVEISNSKGIHRVINISHEHIRVSGFYDCRASFYNYDGTCQYPEYHSLRINRILKPSEVVIKIGCLTGTVQRSWANDFQFILIHDSVNYSAISFSSLDEPTLELVMELLEAIKSEL